MVCSLSKDKSFPDYTTSTRIAQAKAPRLPEFAEKYNARKPFLLAGKNTFRATKDIRDKSVLSRLAWDLGILDELAETL